MIDPSYAQANAGLILNLVGKGTQLEVENQLNKHAKSFRVIEANGNTFIHNGEDFSGNPIKMGSTAVIPVCGPIMKFDGACGEAGSMTRANQVNQISQLEEIDTIVFEMDTPGGMVDGTQTFADAIKNSPKRTIAFVNDGMAASAGYWLMSACDEAYASRKTDSIGSIGVYTTVMDVAAFYQSKGIPVKDVYATQSVEKNKAYRDVFGAEPNEDLLKADLDFIADTFITTVEANRAGKLNFEAGDPFKGALYNAEQAQAIGLIDGIKSLDEILADKKATTKTAKTNSKSKNSITNNMEELKNVCAALGVDALENDAEGFVSLNTDQLAELEAKLGQESPKVTELTADVEALGTRIETLTENMEASSEILGKMNTAISSALEAAGAENTEVSAENAVERIAELKATLEEWGNKAGETASVAAADGDAQNKNTDPAVSKLVRAAAAAKSVK